MSLFRIRNLRQTDLGALADLINRADRADRTGLVTSPEDLAHDLAEPGMGGRENVLLAEAGEQLIGYTLVRMVNADTSRLLAIGTVDPGWRRRGVGTALLRRAEHRAAELAGHRPFVLDLPVQHLVAGACELARSLGYVVAREYLRMVHPDVDCAPEAALPAHIALHDYVRGRDEEKFVTAYTETFADHWGEEPHTLAAEQHRTHGPSFRPQDNLLAINSEGAIVGFCLLHPYGPRSDEREPATIDDLGVRPAYRGQGLGRALLLAGMRRLREQGAQAVALFVDAASPYPSARLYESVGFVAGGGVTLFRKTVGGPGGADS